MTQDHLDRRLDDLPFAPFRLHLSEGTVIDVSDPTHVLVSPSTVYLPSRYQDREDAREPSRWRTVALAHIVMFSDLGDSPLSR